VDPGIRHQLQKPFSPTKTHKKTWQTCLKKIFWYSGLCFIKKMGIDDFAWFILIMGPFIATPSYPVI